MSEGVKDKKRKHQNEALRKKLFLSPFTSICFIETKPTTASVSVLPLFVRLDSCLQQQVFQCLLYFQLDQISKACNSRYFCVVFVTFFLADTVCTPAIAGILISSLLLCCQQKEPAIAGIFMSSLFGIGIIIKAVSLQQQVF